MRRGGAAKSLHGERAARLFNVKGIKEKRTVVDVGEARGEMGRRGEACKEAWSRKLSTLV